MRGPSFSLLLSPQARFVAGTFSSAERRRRPGGAEAHSFRRDSYVRADANRADDQLQHTVALACKTPEGARLSRKPPEDIPGPHQCSRDNHSPPDTAPALCGRRSRARRSPIGPSEPRIGARNLSSPRGSCSAPTGRCRKATNISRPRAWSAIQEAPPLGARTPPKQTLSLLQRSVVTASYCPHTRR